MRGKHNKLGEGERKVRLGHDSLPNIAISVAETIYVVLPGPKQEVNSTVILPPLEFPALAFSLAFKLSFEATMKDHYYFMINFDETHPQPRGRAL